MKVHLRIPRFNRIFTASPAQYELLFDSGRFWDTLILISQKKLARHPTLKLPMYNTNILKSKLNQIMGPQFKSLGVWTWTVQPWENSLRVFMGTKIRKEITIESKHSSAQELDSLLVAYFIHPKHLRKVSTCRQKYRHVQILCIIGWRGSLVDIVLGLGPGVPDTIPSSGKNFVFRNSLVELHLSV